MMRCAVHDELSPCLQRLTRLASCRLWKRNSIVRHGARCSEISSSFVSTFLNQTGQPLPTDDLYGAFFGRVVAATGKYIF